MCERVSFGNVSDMTHPLEQGENGFLESARRSYKLILALSLFAFLFIITLSVGQEERKRIEAIDALMAEYDQHRRNIRSSHGEDIPETVVRAVTTLDEDSSTMNLAGRLTATELGRWLQRRFCIHVVHLAEASLTSQSISRNSQIIYIQTIEALIEDDNRNIAEVILGHIDSKESVVISYSLYVSPPVSQNCADDPTQGSDYPTTIDLAMTIGIAVRYSETGYNDWGSVRVGVSATLDSIDVPSSSILDLARKVGKEHDHIAVDETKFEIVLAPEVSDQHADSSLDKLRAALTEGMMRDAFGRHKISVLGNVIPGRMLVLGIPIVFISLLYYCLGNISHLARIIGGNKKSVGLFPWIPVMPVALKVRPTLKEGKSHLSKWGAVDSFAHFVVLPVVPLVALYLKFEILLTDLGLTIMALGLICVALGLLCYFSLRRIGRVEASKEERVHAKSTCSQSCT